MGISWLGYQETLKKETFCRKNQPKIQWYSQNEEQKRKKFGVVFWQVFLFQKYAMANFARQFLTSENYGYQ